MFPSKCNVTGMLTSKCNVTGMLTGNGNMWTESSYTCNICYDKVDEGVRWEVKGEKGRSKAMVHVEIDITGHQHGEGHGQPATIKAKATKQKKCLPKNHFAALYVFYLGRCTKNQPTPSDYTVVMLHSCKKWYSAASLNEPMRRKQQTWKIKTQENQKLVPITNLQWFC